MRDPHAPANPALAENDFHFVLRQLTEACQPAFRRESPLLRDRQLPEDRSVGRPPSCGEEIALANQVFQRFFTEDVAERLLGADGRRIVRDRNEWLWCFRHIRCCIAFGWLLRRGQRTSRSFAYYLYRYWTWVRGSLDTPVSHPLTDTERRDFRILVEASVGTLKPYLTSQLAPLPPGAPNQAVSGLDLWREEAETTSICERLLTSETAPALLGREIFLVRSSHPLFRFCLCWCLCAFRFGCRLAPARTPTDLEKCLSGYFGSLRRIVGSMNDEIRPPVIPEKTPGQVGPSWSL